jgi:hypothetical protein
MCLKFKDVSISIWILVYNQILVSHPDQMNTNFCTKWGTYAYQKIPFGLINIGVTFQRSMDIEFHGLINKFIVVYMNDVMVFLKIIRITLLTCDISSRDVVNM